MSKPDFYGFVEFESRDTLGQRQVDSVRLQHEEGATWFRYTVVSEEHPRPPYPQGLYVEGWLERPAEMPPFDFPLTSDHSTD